MAGSAQRARQTALLVKWAAKTLAASGIKPETINMIESLILITRHSDVPQTVDEKLIVDIDLSILGRPADIYEVYEKNIRTEYRWVPSSLYRKKRREILTTFLQRDSIYQLPEFVEAYENQARINLKKVISETL